MSKFIDPAFIHYSAEFDGVTIEGSNEVCELLEQLLIIDFDGLVAIETKKNPKFDFENAEWTSYDMVFNACNEQGDLVEVTAKSETYLLRSGTNVVTVVLKQS